MSNVKKVYELVGMDACRMTTTYCGVKVNMEFKNGNHMRKKGAILITANKFVQDAIEKDPRFGTSFILSKTYPMDSVPVDKTIESDEEEENPNRRRLGRRRNSKASETVVPSSAATTVVEEVKSINDAIDWFAAKGEVVESKEQMTEFCEKHHVSFPNIKF